MQIEQQYEGLIHIKCLKCQIFIYFAKSMLLMKIFIPLTLVLILNDITSQYSQFFRNASGKNIHFNWVVSTLLSFREIFIFKCKTHLGYKMSNFSFFEIINGFNG